MINKIYRTKEDLKKYWETLKEYRFEGYIWLGESDSPVLLDGEKLPSWENWDGNFIWEMNVYAEGKFSLSIRFLGGCWLVSRVDWNGEAVPGEEIVVHQYMTRHFEGRKYLTFKEAWQPVEDFLFCDGMKVLKPAWIAFTGFDKGGAA